MIRDSKTLREFEAGYQRNQLTLSYAQALERFAALWTEARALRPDLGSDWEEDLQPDLRIARILNGLPDPVAQVPGREDLVNRAARLTATG